MCRVFNEDVPGKSALVGGGLEQAFLLRVLVEEAVTVLAAEALLDRLELRDDSFRLAQRALQIGATAG
jgi:hypothetical protein